MIPPAFHGMHVDALVRALRQLEVDGLDKCGCCGVHWSLYLTFACCLASQAIQRRHRGRPRREVLRKIAPVPQPFCGLCTERAVRPAGLFCCLRRYRAWFRARNRHARVAVAAACWRVLASPRHAVTHARGWHATSCQSRSPHRTCLLCSRIGRGTAAVWRPGTSSGRRAVGVASATSWRANPSLLRSRGRCGGGPCLIQASLRLGRCRSS